MIKPSYRSVRRLEREITSAGLPTSYKFVNWLLRKLLNSSDNYIKVTKEDVKIKFADKMSENIQSISDHSFTSYRNHLENLGFIEVASVAGSIKTQWGAGRKMRPYIEEIRKINQIELNERVKNTEKAITLMAEKLGLEPPFTVDNIILQLDKKEKL